CVSGGACPVSGRHCLVNAAPADWPTVRLRPADALPVRHRSGGVLDWCRGLVGDAMTGPRGAPMSEILTPEQVDKRRAASVFVEPQCAVLELCDSHEALRARAEQVEAERDRLMLRLDHVDYTAREGGDVR